MTAFAFRRLPIRLGVALAALAVLVAITTVPTSSTPTARANGGPPLDIVFMIDESGSMGGDIADVKARVNEIAIQLELSTDPRYALVKQRLDDGELGELDAVFARRLNNVGSQDVLRGRVSVLSFLGVHDFDYILWLSDSRPVRVHTESVAKVHRAAGYDVEDHTFTLVRFADDSIACVEAGWVLPDSHPRRADIKLEVKRNEQPRR